MSNNQKPIIGGIFGTHTEWDENGNVTVKDDFHLRIYWDLFHSGAIKKLKGNMFQVYIAIAMHLDQRGEGWPTQQRIADLLGLSRNTVGTAIKQLEQEGFITREKIRTSGKFDNTIYKIKFAPNKTEEKREENHAQKLSTVHAQELGMIETPENQGLDHAQNINTVTMPNFSAPSFQHEELGTKKELLSKKDPLIKKDKNHHLNEIEKAKKEVSATQETNMVVEIQSLIQNHFQIQLNHTEISRLMIQATKLGKELSSVISETKEHFLSTREPIRDLVATLMHGINVGWDKPKNTMVGFLPQSITQEQIDFVEPSPEEQVALEKRKQEMLAAMRSIRPNHMNHT